MIRTHGIRALFAALLMLVMAAPHAQEFDEGIEYQRITPAQPTATDKIEVIELFWYGCPHCFNFEPHVNAWLRRKPDNVEFTRIPAVFNAQWALHARAFYTAEALDVLDRVHGPIFETIHVKKRPLNSEQALAALFASHGVDEKTFKQTFRSFAVDAKVRRAADLSQRYQIDGVPALIVEGKYRIEGANAGGLRGMIDVLGYLIDKEGQAQN